MVHVGILAGGRSLKDNDQRDAMRNLRRQALGIQREPTPPQHIMGALQSMGVMVRRA